MPYNELLNIFSSAPPRGALHSPLLSYKTFEPGRDDEAEWDNRNQEIQTLVLNPDLYPLKVLPRFRIGWSSREYQLDWHREGFYLNWSRECCIRGFCLGQQRLVTLGKKTLVMSLSFDMLSQDEVTKPLMIGSPTELQAISENAFAIATPYAFRGRHIERLTRRRFGYGRCTSLPSDQELILTMLRHGKKLLDSSSLVVSLGSGSMLAQVPTYLDRRCPVQQITRLLDR